MFKAILLSSTLLLGSFSWAHSEHMKAPDIQMVEGDLQNKPEMMRSTSVKLLESPIGITGDHGQGRFFKEEQTETQKLVNQGFTMLNMFQYTDAFRSFHTALSLDPKSVESYIGRAFASMSLDPRQSYYLQITKTFLETNKDALTKEQAAWGNLLLAIMVQADVNGNSLTTASAYRALGQADSTNLEVAIFGNWISNTYDVSLLQDVLIADPTNAGATHYLLHLGEMNNDHNTAIFHGEKLAKFALGSGHGQHMYGHALPHFNKWNEADKQFAISHAIHMAWAQKNGVHPSEDWHYSHNLDLWSVTNMVLNPSKAVLILEELEQFSYNYSLDLLDLRIVTGTDPAVEDAKISEYESRPEGWANFVKTSRSFYKIINEKDAFAVNRMAIAGDLQWTNFEERVLSRLDRRDPRHGKYKTLLSTIFLIEANHNSNISLANEITDKVTTDLVREFARGGFDGWRKSVLETMIYLKIFQVYGLTDAENALRENVIDVYMNPID